MLVVPSDKKTTDDASQPPPADPPSYEDSQGSLRPNASLPSTSSAPRASNYVTLAQIHGTIKGSWVIDPNLPIPAALRVAPPPGEPERNLLLRTQNGSVTADVTIVQSVPAASGHHPVLLEAGTYNGSVKFNLHDGPLPIPQATRPPVKVNLQTNNGAITIRIPRSFRGIVDSKCHFGTPKPSEEVTAQIRHSQHDGTLRRVFIGDYDDEDFSLETWDGDEIKAETKLGNINVCYDDEVKSGDEKGVLAKLWNALF